MRVTLYLRCRGIPTSHVELISTRLETDRRGILVFTMPENDAETIRLGTTDLTAFNPEGRVPILLFPDGRKLAQTGPIIEYLEETLPDGIATGQTLLPQDPWLAAQAKRIMWIIAADVQPYQNIPFIIQAMGEWGMIKADPTVHPLRLHYIRREFGAIELLLQECAGKFAVGDEVSLADFFLVPQIRNALLARIDLAAEFPILWSVFENMKTVAAAREVMDEAGGAIQPLAFNRENFVSYAGSQK